MKIKRTLALVLLVAALCAIGTVRAAERDEMRRLERWKVTNPCFNSAGKWFTREYIIEED